MELVAVNATEISGPSFSATRRTEVIAIARPERLPARPAASNRWPHTYAVVTADGTVASANDASSIAAVAAMAPRTVRRRRRPTSTMRYQRRSMSAVSVKQDPRRWLPPAALGDRLSDGRRLAGGKIDVTGVEFDGSGGMPPPEIDIAVVDPREDRASIGFQPHGVARIDPGEKVRPAGQH